MLKEKAVLESVELRQAVTEFAQFVEPLVSEDTPTGHWPPGGPWQK